MEKISLFVISSALLLLGIWEVVTWPQWALSNTPLFILFGKKFHLLYSLAELLSASAFAIFGLFGIYFSSIVEGTRSHKITGRFEVLLLIPILVLFFSANSFMVIGAELMAHNRILRALAGRLWRWRFQHAGQETLAQIEDNFQCCGWTSSHNFSVSPFCGQYPTKRITSCVPFILNYSGRAVYRQGLFVGIYTLPLILLATLVIWTHKLDPVSADVEEAEVLNERRKQLYSGNAPAIQIQ